MQKKPYREEPFIKVRRSSIHNRGVFAARDIPEGTRVIEYVGERVTKAEAARRYEQTYEQNRSNKDMGAVYLFELNKRYDLDGNVSYNTARLINHSCDPNCETDIIRGKVWIIALRDIKKGEEITYNYGYTYDDHKDHRCYCGSQKCMGYILGEEHWWKLKRKRTMERKRRLNGRHTSRRRRTP